MDASRQPPHILLVAFPIQSHINPALQFAAHLLRSGAHVTLATTVAGAKRMNKSGGAAPAGLSFATISDGFDDGGKPAPDAYMSSLKRRGAETLSALVAAAGGESPPYTCVVYTILLPWVADVARRHRLPSALLWIQNAALFAIYYHYFNGYGDVIDKCDENDPGWRVELPSLPPLRACDLPSFLAPSNPYSFAMPALKEQFEELERSESPTILVNTFDSLEHEIIESFRSRFKISAVGPLLPNEDNNSSSDGFRVDLFTRPEEDYVAWLDTKADNSVVYVSFGSISVLSKTQKEEIALALLECKRPFLWVIRKNLGEEEEKEEEEVTERWEELKGLGMVVPWCSQVEVLSHRAVGCFVTHCGWNSTLESLTAGVPVVGVPQWTDQLTNATMLESAWGVGVRVRDGTVVAGEKVVGREELRRCVEEVMESEEVRGNARRWREKAVMAVRANGSSEVNVRAFVEEVWKMSRTRFDVDQEEL